MTNELKRREKKKLAKKATSDVMEYLSHNGTPSGFYDFFSDIAYPDDRYGTTRQKYLPGSDCEQAAVFSAFMASEITAFNVKRDKMFLYGKVSTTLFNKRGKMIKRKLTYNAAAAKLDAIVSDMEAKKTEQKSALENIKKYYTEKSKREAVNDAPEITAFYEAKQSAAERDSQLKIAASDKIIAAVKSEKQRITDVFAAGSEAMLSMTVLRINTYYEYAADLLRALPPKCISVDDLVKYYHADPLRCFNRPGGVQK